MGILKIILSVCSVVIFTGCQRWQSANNLHPKYFKTENGKAVNLSDSLNFSSSSLDLSSYRKYQTFDEFEMKGVGTPLKYVNPSLGDYNDFECITYHENVHGYNANAGDTPNGEIETIIQTAKCDAWHNATGSYIGSQASYAVNALNAIRRSSQINDYISRLNDAFRGYAEFSYSNNIVEVSNLMQEIEVLWQRK